MCLVTLMRLQGEDPEAVAWLDKDVISLLRAAKVITDGQKVRLASNSRLPEYTLEHAEVVNAIRPPRELIKSSQKWLVILVPPNRPTDNIELFRGCTQFILTRAGLGRAKEVVAGNYPSLLQPKNFSTIVMPAFRALMHPQPHHLTQSW